MPGTNMPRYPAKMERESTLPARKDTTRKIPARQGTR